MVCYFVWHHFANFGLLFLFKKYSFTYKMDKSKEKEEQSIMDKSMRSVFGTCLFILSCASFDTVMVEKYL